MLSPDIVKLSVHNILHPYDDLDDDLRASNLIVLVESKIKHEIFNKKIDFLTIFKKEISKKEERTTKILNLVQILNSLAGGIYPSNNYFVASRS